MKQQEKHHILRPPVGPCGGQLGWPAWAQHLGGTPQSAAPLYLPPVSLLGASDALRNVSEVAIVRSTGEGWNWSVPTSIAKC